MTEKQKETRGFIIAAILILAILGDSHGYAKKGLDYSIAMEQKTGKHWIQDLHGQPLGDY